MDNAGPSSKGKVSRVPTVATHIVPRCERERSSSEALRVPQQIQSGGNSVIELFMQVKEEEILEHLCSILNDPDPLVLAWYEKSVLLARTGRDQLHEHWSHIE